MTGASASSTEAPVGGSVSVFSYALGALSLHGDGRTVNDSSSSESEAVPRTLGEILEEEVPLLPEE